MSQTGPRSPLNSWTVGSIFLISIVVIAFQLLLLRTLAVTYYYHFTYLVISTALLGFGASGTFLALCFDYLKRNFPFWNLFFLFLFLISIPLTYLAADALPLDTQYVLYDRNQLMYLLAYNALMFIPFFFGGIVIGFMITYYKRHVPLLYGANLAGSGAGGIVALLLMSLLPAHQLPFVMVPLAFAAMIVFLISTGLHSREGGVKAIALVSAGLLITMLAVVMTPPESIDPYKDLSHFRQLEQQGDAEHIERRFGPRGQIDIFDSPTFHYTLFAGPHAIVVPPPQLAVLMDGSVMAPLFMIDDEEEAEILDYTPQSLPLRLLESPRVLLLGEVSGVNAWLALRMGAGEVTVVQTNPQLIRLIRDDLADRGGRIYDHERIRIVNEDPRTYLQSRDRQYDLIQFVAGEEMATGTGGLQGLNENFLLTRESVVRALERLNPDGLLSITRGIQSPPRDNIKLFSLFADASRAYGLDQPGDHMLVSRNYLAANTLLSKSPIDSNRVNRFLESAGQLQLDLEYYPGIISDEIDQRNRIEGPEGAPYSYLHHALGEFLHGDADSFYDDWVYHVRTPTDNSPYFYDFFKWGSLDTFIETYGEQWFERLELGYVILVITFLQQLLAAFILILLPLLARRSLFASRSNKLPTLFHFGMIGTGFMFLEITFIQTFTRFLGDPVFSAAAVICSILIFSGLGSLLQSYIRIPVLQRVRVAVLAVLICSLFYLVFSEAILDLFIGFASGWRFLVSIILIAPVSFFLGWMFPTGVEILGRRDEELIPWAWGVDGFASVAAAPLAIILSMSIGLTGVILLGMLCYSLAGVTSWFWRL